MRRQCYVTKQKHYDQTEQMWISDTWNADRN